MAIPVMPKYVSRILMRLERNGHSAYLTGGCVRDMLMSRRPHDWDVSTSARSEEVKTLFPKTITVGEAFGTVAVVIGKKAVEVTTLRSEADYRDHRRPGQISFISDLDRDLSRRDFTMNAMALPLSGILIDPFGGRTDIERNMIRCVGDPLERFSEDALRMLRALRFSAALGFEIEETVLRAIAQCAHLACDLSAERIREETEKILLSRKPELLGRAFSAGLYDRYLKRPISPLEKLQKIGGLPKKKRERWCALCAVLEDAQLIGSPEQFLRSLRLDSQTVRLCRDSAAAGKDFPAGLYELKLLVARSGCAAASCAAAVADVLSGRGHLKQLKSVLKGGECVSLKQLAIGGGDLMPMGYVPGETMGRALEQLLDHVLRHPEDNEREVLLKRAEEMLHTKV